jgi:hypothetical protein
MAALDGIVVSKDDPWAAMRLGRAGKPRRGCRSSHRLWARQSEVRLCVLTPMDTPDGGASRVALTPQSTSGHDFFGR